MAVTEQWYSERLQMTAGMARWGYYGTPVLVFPTAGGDAEEIERMHLVDVCSELLAAGRVKLYSIDSVAGMAMMRHDGSLDYRMTLFNRFHEYIAKEVVPAIHADLGGSDQPIIATGASIGAFNSLAVLCRYPQYFGTAICMSGTYHIERFLENAMNEDFYFSSPLHFLPNLTGPQLDKLRTRFVLLTSGEGAWENIGESWEVADLLGRKGIPNRVDSWGTDWIHDWDTWRAMLPRYLDEFA